MNSSVMGLLGLVVGLGIGAFGMYQARIHEPSNELAFAVHRTIDVGASAPHIVYAGECRFSKERWPTKNQAL